MGVGLKSFKIFQVVVLANIHLVVLVVSTHQCTSGSDLSNWGGDKISILYIVFLIITSSRSTHLLWIMCTQPHTRVVYMEQRPWDTGIPMRPMIHDRNCDTSHSSAKQLAGPFFTCQADLQRLCLGGKAIMRGVDPKQKMVWHTQNDISMLA